MKPNKRLIISVIIALIFLFIIFQFTLRHTQQKQKTTEPLFQAVITAQQKNIPPSPDKLSAKKTKQTIATEQQLNTPETTDDTADYIVQCQELDAQQYKELTQLHDEVIAKKLNLDDPEEKLAPLLFQLTDNYHSLSKENKLVHDIAENKSLLNYHERFPTEPLTFHRLLTKCSNAHSNNGLGYCTAAF